MLKVTEQGIVLTIKIVPNSSKNDIIIEEDFVKIKITAQPVENKANKALIEFLSKMLKVPKTKIEIIKGLSSKEKTISILVADIQKQNEIKKLLTK